MDVADSAPASRNAAAESASSMFMWKRSARIRTCGKPRPAQPRGGFAEAVEEVRLVTIQRLVKQRNTMIARRALRVPPAHRRDIRALARASLSPSQRPCIEPMIAGAAHCPATSMIDFDELPRLSPNHRVGMGQRKLVHHPAGTGADRRDSERVAFHQTGDRSDVQFRCGTRKYFHRVKPKFLRPRESIVETL